MERREGKKREKFCTCAFAFHAFSMGELFLPFLRILQEPGWCFHSSTFIRQGERFENFFLSPIGFEKERITPLVWYQYSYSEARSVLVDDRYLCISNGMYGHCLLRLVLVSGVYRGWWGEEGASCPVLCKSGKSVPAVSNQSFMGDIPPTQLRLKEGSWAGNLD